MPRYTLHGSTLKDDIAALREEIAALKAAAREAAPTDSATVSPEAARVAEIGFKGSRAEAVASKAPKRYCPRHQHGFAFDKKVCPRDGQPIPQ